MAKFSDADLKAITTGSSLHVIGHLVESQGKGQTCEVQADSFRVFGTADPEEYPLQKKGPHSGVPARKGSPAPPNQHVRRSSARSFGAGLCRS